MFNGIKYYCLKCETTNACKCNCYSNHLVFNHKLRPPRNAKNKKRFRQFIDTCPQFLNLLNKDNLDIAIEFFKKIKYKSSYLDSIISSILKSDKT
jgi:hypothetical protein